MRPSDRVDWVIAFAFCVAHDRRIWAYLHRGRPTVIGAGPLSNLPRVLRRSLHAPEHPELTLSRTDPGLFANAWQVECSHRPGPVGGDIEPGKSSGSIDRHAGVTAGLFGLVHGGVAQVHEVLVGASSAEGCGYTDTC